jgi:hypothetical protein
MLSEYKINYSIKKNLLFKIVPLLLILFAIYAAYLFYEFQNALELYEDRHKNVVINSCMDVIDGVFTNYAELESKFNACVAGYKMYEANNRREYYAALTYSFLKRTPQFSAYWIDFDRNKFDGLDDQYINKGYFSDDGRMDISWFRLNKEITFQKLTAEEHQMELEEDFFRIPRETKRRCITEPIFYDYTGNEGVYTLSICSPIFDDKGLFVGVTGGDLLLDEIFTTITKYKPELVQNISLISKTGNYYCHINRHLVGSNLSDNPLLKGSNIDSILSVVNSGKRCQVNNLTNAQNKKLTMNYIPLKIIDVDIYDIIVGVELLDDIVKIDSEQYYNSLSLYLVISFVIIIFLVTVIFLMINNAIENVILTKLDIIKYNTAIHNTDKL